MQWDLHGSIIESTSIVIFLYRSSNEETKSTDGDETSNVGTDERSKGSEDDSNDSYCLPTDQALQFLRSAHEHLGRCVRVLITKQISSVRSYKVLPHVYNGILS